MRFKTFQVLNRPKRGSILNKMDFTVSKILQHKEIGKIVINNSLQIMLSILIFIIHKPNLFKCVK